VQDHFLIDVERAEIDAGIVEAFPAGGKGRVGKLKQAAVRPDRIRQDSVAARDVCVDIERMPPEVAVTVIRRVLGTDRPGS
jgi:hypothetical protein